MARTTDLDLTDKDISGLTSPDALMSFLGRLGYETNARKALTPESIGLAGESAGALKKIELLSEDREQFLRVVFAQPRSLTAKVRTDLARALGKSTVDHMLIISTDFEALEFVLIDKPKSERRGPASLARRAPVPRTIVVDRRRPTPGNRRALRRLTWTCQDALDQFAKLKSVFQAAAFTSDYFQNRNLFADYYLEHRLRERPAWKDNPSNPFAAVRDLLGDAEKRWRGQGKTVVREQLYEPLFARLGFAAARGRPDQSERAEPDYLLEDATGEVLTAAFVYNWDRWLDGPDPNDGDTPDENPGASVISALDGEVADWIIVTNGKQWRLYGRHAYARATNFYEVDLVEALAASGDTDPNEAFRYWWLFFRADAYRGRAGEGEVWLDSILRGCREYAKRLGDRLKDRIFVSIFPHLAEGFLADRKGRLGQKGDPTESELADVFEATLTMLYRLLFLLHAESRDLLPIREAPYQAASLKTIKEEVAEKAGIALDDVPDRLRKSYSDVETGLYDRLGDLFTVMEKGDPVRNVPTYNGGLFNTSPDDSDKREHRIARFLKRHKVPDRHLALALDRLSRDQDERTLGLVPIDYKSLEVRHLGSIYEGLLEFKLVLADEDKTTQAEKGQERYISLTRAKAKRGGRAEVVVRKGEVYLSNDKAERKASGSYYTPDPIVEYIVAQTVGPMLDEKLEALRADFRKVRKTFDNEVQKATAYPPQEASPKDKEAIRRFAEEKTYATHKDLVERLFDLKVLDPAMGSGHFLVESVDFITDRLLKFLSAFPINPVTFALERTRTSILESLGEQGVTVDPAKLTDINLLKRHVLKRCIYGVDLNPMAVELAKVSLWLDAFTLGAPLNFLDHHLRCGNSLVGGTMADLESLIGSRVQFPKIRQELAASLDMMLQVIRHSDATAEEARESADLYRSARRRLSGAEMAIDLIVSEAFGVREAAELVEKGYDLRYESRDAFFESLGHGKDRETAEAAMAKARELSFFCWDLEFPEVFFGTTANDLRRARQGPRLATTDQGFDAVLGKPPYVRMELIKPLKPFLMTRYRCYADRAALFIYFYEKAVKLLRPGGRTAFIAPSTWTKTKAGEGLRAFLKNETTLDSFLDFGDLPLFEDATTYPCVLSARRQPPTPGGVIASARVQSLDNSDRSSYLHSHTIAVPQAELGNCGWNFENPVAARLRERVFAAGPPLKEYCGSPLYGIKTGLNEAFVIDTQRRDQLIAEDPRCAEVIEPLLEGKDLKAWRAEWRGLWLIYTHHGVDIKRYPAILAYLKTFKGKLERRATSDNHMWYELQQPQWAYFPRLKSAKIFYPHFSRTPSFSFDTKGFLGNDKTYCIPVDDNYLLGVLNSQLTWFIIQGMCSPKRGGWYEMRVQYIQTMPIAPAPHRARRVIAEIAEQLSRDPMPDRLSLERALNREVAELYGLSETEQAYLGANAPTSPAAAALDDEE